MSRQTLIVVGLLVFGVLAFFVYKRAKSEDASYSSKTAASSKDFPTISSPEDIDKIDITNADKGEVVLEKQGDKWMMTKPNQGPGDQASIKQIVDNLKEIKIDSEVKLALDEEVKKDKQLDAAHAVHVVTFKGADKKTDLLFGKSGAVGQLAMLPDKPTTVYAIKGYSAYLYSKEAKFFRDRDLFKFDDANASQVTIKNKAGDFSFTKGGDKWGATFKGKPLANFDDDKLKQLLVAYKSLQAEDFGDGKSPADTGLDAPEATITIALKDNAGTYTLKIGKVSNGTQRYAQKEGDAMIYVVAQNAADWATAELSKFQKPVADGGAGDGGGKDASAKK